MSSTGKLLLSVRVLVAHYGALVPLAYLAAFRRQAPWGFWLAAFGFGVSFAADLVAQLTGGSWIAVPWYNVIQWGFFALALVSSDAEAVAIPVLLYVSVGTLFYLLMMAHRNDPAPYTVFMQWWYWYQATRLTAFALFVRAAWRVRVG